MLFDSSGATRHPRCDSLPQKEHVLLYTSDQLEPENFHFSPYLCKLWRWPVYWEENTNLVSELEDEIKNKIISLLAGPSLIINPLPPSWVKLQEIDLCIADKKCIAWMHCKSLWIKASAKYINVNVNVNSIYSASGETSFRKYDKRSRLYLGMLIQYTLMAFSVSSGQFTLKYSVMSLERSSDKVPL